MLMLATVSVVNPESRTDGAESDPAGANERRAERQPGLINPAASWSSSHTEAACGDCFLPQRPALPVQHSNPKSSGTRP